jgi:hypothetical protein
MKAYPTVKLGWPSRRLHRARPRRCVRLAEGRQCSDCTAQPEQDYVHAGVVQTVARNTADLGYLTVHAGVQLAQGTFAAGATSMEETVSPRSRFAAARIMLGPPPVHEGECGKFNSIRWLKNRDVAEDCVAFPISCKMTAPCMRTCPRKATVPPERSAVARGACDCRRESGRGSWRVYPCPPVSRSSSAERLAVV